MHIFSYGIVRTDGKGPNGLGVRQFQDYLVQKCAPAQGASLGYALDAAHQGAGLMHEALQAVIGEAFGPLNLHRLQAAYRPENTRSAAVLQRLGFRELGLARDYLFIDGAWRDHERWAKLADDEPPRS